MPFNMSLAPSELIGWPFFLCSTTNSLRPYIHTWLFNHPCSKRLGSSSHLPWMPQPQPRLDPSPVFAFLDISTDNNHIAARVKGTQNASWLRKRMCMVRSLRWGYHTSNLHGGGLSNSKSWLERWSSKGSITHCCDALFGFFVFKKRWLDSL